MYKITTVVPNNKLRTLRESGDLNLSSEELEGTTTVINIVKENDPKALKLIIGFFDLIADGIVESLTVTKCNDNHKQTEV